MIEEYQNVFRDELPGVPPDRGFRHIIGTADDNFVFRPPHKIPSLELGESLRQLNELLELGLEIPSVLP